LFSGYPEGSPVAREQDAATVVTHTWLLSVQVKKELQPFGEELRAKFKETKDFLLLVRIGCSGLILLATVRNFVSHSLAVVDFQSDCKYWLALAVQRFSEDS
jgi:hypothetical protein